MVKHALTFAGVMFILLAAALSLDLSPTHGYRMLEGFKVPIVTMRDGERIVRWQPPANWKIGSGGEKLVLSSADFAGATMELQTIKRDPELRDAFATPELRREWLSRFLPKDAGDVSILSENGSPYMLHELPSWEVVYQFVSQARRVTSSLSFVDINERERLVLNVTALPSDFAAVHDAAISSMFSWSWAE